MAQLVKNLPAMWETWVQSQGWKDPLEKGKATHSSILDWIHGVAKSQTRLSDFHFHKVLEGVRKPELTGILRSYQVSMQKVTWKWKLREKDV